MANSKKVSAGVWALSPRDAIVEQVASKARPVWNGLRSLNYEAPPWMNSETRQLLLSRGHIHDCSKLTLTAYWIEKHLVRITGGTGKAASAIRNLLGFTNSPGFARCLEQIAKEAETFVVAALEGRLQTAALEIPARGISDFSYEDVMDLLEDIARGHLAGNMMRAARIAFNRLYAPTGDAMLDENRGAIVTVSSAAKALNRKARSVKDVLGLERQARTRAVTAKQEASIERFGITDEAEALEAQLRAIHGDGFDAWYEEMIALVRRWTKYIDRSSALLRDAKAFKGYALSLFHGQHALPTFYLSVLRAIAWARDGKGKPSPLRLALESVACSNGALPPDTHKDHAMEARQLFYLLRNLVVRDPRAFVHKNAKPDISVDALIFGEFRRQKGLRAGEEPFKIPLIVKAANELRASLREDPFGPGAIAIRGEIFGTILVQLRA